MVVAMGLMGLFSGKRSRRFPPISINPETFRLKLSDRVYDLGKALGARGKGKIYLKVSRQQAIILPEKSWRANIVIAIVGMNLLSGEIKLSGNAQNRIRAGGREMFYIIASVEQVKGQPDQELVEFISEVAVTLNRMHSNYALMAMGDRRRQGVTPDDKENVARAMRGFFADPRIKLKGGAG